MIGVEKIVENLLVLYYGVIEDIKKKVEIEEYEEEGMEGEDKLKKGKKELRIGMGKVMVKLVLVL